MSPSASDSTAARDALTARVLPQMVLSTGGAASMTAAPVPLPPFISSEGRARMRFEVEGNAIITGGAGTLGLEGGKALLEHGLAGLMIFDVVDTAQMQARMLELQTEFPDAKLDYRQVDTTDGDGVAKAVEDTAAVLGSVDILLCFAGLVDCTHAIDLSAAAWRRILDVNTTGSFLCAQAAARQMISQNSGGSIVFVASVSGHRVNFPQPQVSYNVSKAALLTMKSCLAAEWARYGIRVNSISPGYMDTVLNEGEGIADARAIWTARNPLGRMGAPNELTGAVVLLSSSSGTYMSGSDIVVDGGQIVF